MSATIDVEKISKRFGATVALDEVSLSVETGKVLALLGPNGSGKTTLLRVLTTLLRPDSGHASIGGFDVQKDAKTVRTLIGLAGQYATVDELLTGRENLELVGLLFHLDKKVYRQRAQEVLERMSLTGAGDKQVKTYSGGMRRRLDLAASLMGMSPVLFLDEPTTGLDPRTRNDLWQFVEELAADGTTVLLTTQYMEEAEHLANSIVVLDSGRVVAKGTADELKANFGNGPSRTNPDLNQVLLPIRDGASVLIAAGRALQDHGVALDDLGIRRPSLDDVFLAITGHTTDTHAVEAGNTEISR
jgi:ABC-2 type transport system ATP-binding protein